MNFFGRPKVPEHDKRSFEHVIAQLKKGLDVEVLQILRHALAVDREASRYCSWSDADVAQALSVIDMQLSASKRLKVTPFWLQESNNK